MDENVSILPGVVFTPEPVAIREPRDLWESLGYELYSPFKAGPVSRQGGVCRWYATNQPPTVIYEIRLNLSRAKNDVRPLSGLHIYLL